jgi:hypothetical protein
MKVGKCAYTKAVAGMKAGQKDLVFLQSHQEWTCNTYDAW